VPIIPALVASLRLRQEDFKFEASLGYIGIPFSKTKQQKTQINQQNGPGQVKW
jgi:hypothetical protein